MDDNSSKQDVVTQVGSGTDKPPQSPSVKRELRQGEQQNLSLWLRGPKRVQRVLGNRTERIEKSSKGCLREGSASQ